MWDDRDCVWGWFTGGRKQAWPLSRASCSPAGYRASQSTAIRWLREHEAERGGCRTHLRGHCFSDWLLGRSVPGSSKFARVSCVPQPHSTIIFPIFPSLSVPAPRPAPPHHRPAEHKIGLLGALESGCKLSEPSSSCLPAFFLPPDPLLHTDHL